MFEVHKLNQNGMQRAKDIQKSFELLLRCIRLTIDPPDTPKDKPRGQREMAICETKLEEACFYAKRAMAMQLENHELTIADTCEIAAEKTKEYLRKEHEITHNEDFVANPVQVKAWQIDKVVYDQVFRKAVSSGHGIGKSSVLAMIHELTIADTCEIAADLAKEKLEKEMAYQFRERAMKILNEDFVANPVTVKAWQIDKVVYDQINSWHVLYFKNRGEYTAFPPMTSRMIPVAGDYLVQQQSDGYEYLNPKDVFERKYSPANQVPSCTESVAVPRGTVDERQRLDALEKRMKMAEGVTCTGQANDRDKDA